MTTLKIKPLCLKTDFATLNSTEGLAALVIQEVFDATDCVSLFSSCRRQRQSNV